MKFNFQCFLKIKTAGKLVALNINIPKPTQFVFDQIIIDSSFSGLSDSAVYAAQIIVAQDVMDINNLSLTLVYNVPAAAVNRILSPSSCFDILI